MRSFLDRGFDRGRGGLSKRHIMLLQSGCRFADPFPEIPGHLGDGFQDLFLAGHLGLFPIDDISSPAVGGPQVEHVSRSDVLDGAFQQRCGSGTNADFSSNLAGDLCFGRLTHQAQSVLDVILGNEIQIRGLQELHLQTLAQRMVKVRVSSEVGEIGDQHRIHGIQSDGLMTAQK